MSWLVKILKLCAFLTALSDEFLLITKYVVDIRGIEILMLED